MVIVGANENYSRALSTGAAELSTSVTINKGPYLRCPRIHCFSFKICWSVMVLLFINAQCESTDDVFAYTI